MSRFLTERSRSRLKILAILTIFSISSFHWRFNITPDEQRSSVRLAPRKFHYEIASQNESSHKEIVIWSNFFGSREVWKDIFKRIIAGKCEESRCSITLDRKKIKTADAVLFHAYDVSLEEKVPTGLQLAGLPTTERNPNQIYIFYSMESPKRMKRTKFKELRNYFNWTMTYRKDSDVVEPFGFVTKRTTPRRRSEIPFATQEELENRKSVVWMASHCDKTAFRHTYIQILKRHIDISIFGKCGIVCDDGDRFGIYGKDVGFSSCERNFRNFAFYLAFENTFCKDYVTEKIYKAWTLGVIPVVMGAVNYSSFAPPKSFIDLKDFKTPWHLAEHLKRVASDAELYNEYLEWQMYYDFEVGSPYNALTCDLCKKLHSHDVSRERSSYDDIVDWFFNDSNCKTIY